MKWSEATFTEKAIRLAAIVMGTIFLRYLMTLKEGTVFALLLMFSAWCLLCEGCFYFGQECNFGQSWWGWGVA